MTEEISLSAFQTTQTAREGLMQPPDACTGCKATGKTLTSRMKPGTIHTEWLCSGCLVS